MGVSLNCPHRELTPRNPRGRRKPGFSFCLPRMSPFYTPVRLEFPILFMTAPHLTANDRRLAARASRPKHAVRWAIRPRAVLWDRNCRTRVGPAQRANNRRLAADYPGDQPSVSRLPPRPPSGPPPAHGARSCCLGRHPLNAPRDPLAGRCRGIPRPRRPPVPRFRSSWGRSPASRLRRCIAVPLLSWRPTSDSRGVCVHHVAPLIRVPSMSHRHRTLALVACASRIPNSLAASRLEAPLRGA